MGDVSGESVDGAALGRELSSAVVFFHEAVAARLGLGAADHKALDVLDRDGPLAPSELATRLGLTRAAVTAMVDRLERSGFVRRSRERADRRRVAVHLMDHRDPAVVAAFANLNESMTAVFRDYPPSQQVAIATFLSATIDILEAVTRELSEAPRRDTTPHPHTDRV